MQQRLPSVKTLMKIESLDLENAKLLRKVLEICSRDKLAELVDDLPTVFPDTNKWWNRCANQPTIDHIKMIMTDEVIGGYGIEHCGEVDRHHGPPLEYINLGDTYDCTLCRFRGRYVVSSWGDIVEKHERLFKER